MGSRAGDPGGGRPPFADAAEVAGVGFQFAASIVLFLFVGRWLDGWLGTRPWFLITGVLVGAAAGFFSMYRQLVIRPRERERRGRGEK